MVPRLHSYLVRIGLSSEPLPPETEQAIAHLLLLLSPAEERAVVDYYGLFGTQRRSLQEIADDQGLSPEDALERIDQCVRKLALTPEWQMIRQAARI